MQFALFPCTWLIQAPLMKLRYIDGDADTTLHIAMSVHCWINLRVVAGEENRG